MEDSAIISSLIAVAALVVSVVSLLRTRKVSELQAKLSQMQIDQMEAQEQALSKTHTSVSIEGFAGHHKWIISNDGNLQACEVYFDVEGDHKPYVVGEHAERFPATLESGHSIQLNAVISTGSPLVFQVGVRWKNPDGTEESREYEVQW